MAMDSKQVGKALNSIAYGQAMMAAIRDYTKELDDENAVSTSNREVDVDDLLDDPELEKLHADRLMAMKQEAEKRARLEKEGYGTYQETTEGEFLELVTKYENVVCHFFHKEFERCKIVDKHMAQLAKKYMETRCIKLSAPDSPFFTVKLGIRVLPCVIMFKHGVSVARIVGFEQLGGKDDFSTGAFEQQLKKADLITSSSSSKARRGGGESSDDEQQQQKSSIRQGFSNITIGDDDEDSDFD